MPEILIDIGGDYKKDLRRRMREYGISQNQLAAELGIKPTHLSRMFNTEIQPRLDTIRDIELAILAIRKRREKQKQRRR